MTHTGRSNARAGELVIEPGGGPAAEIRSDRMMNRGQDLQQHEHDPDDQQRRGQAALLLDGPDEGAHRN